jgi:PIN domain nuclease of toxin-antitoxin system
LLLDTHILLWLEAGDSRLRRSTRARIDDCWRGGGSILISAVSAWEIGLLVDTGRIALDLSPSKWVGRAVARPGVEVADLTPEAAASAYDWVGFDHRDPADRLLIATAIDLECPLVTYDARIIAFAERRGRSLGLAVES